MRKPQATQAVLVIGGGFFGMFIAEWLARQGCRVSIVEKNPDFMQRASFANQARVHNGYHYPRSVLTALRSRITFPRFVRDFHPCIHDQFEKYYMIARLMGNVTAMQFQTFCQRIGAPYEPAPSRITKLVNPALIDAVFQVTEYSFDAVKLKEEMKARLEDAGVSILLNAAARHVRQETGDQLMADIQHGDGASTTLGGLRHVFNCTYSMINGVNVGSSIEIIPLKHELTELCLIQTPSELQHCGVTVMCGPFFSFMPFPARGCHSFSHVRYTPHYEWRDSRDAAYVDAHDHFRNARKKSAWGAMWRDAARYIPILEDARYVDSIWEVKTVLPRSDSDDSRPILFRPNHGIKGFHCIMGGKVDNIYDAVSEIDRAGLLAQR